jgi:predicted RND superfamily exporter protein
MNRFLIGLSYLLVLNFELALFLMGGVYASKYLNEHLQQSFDWVIVTVPISVLLCCYVVYRYLVFVVKNDRKKAKHD